MGEELNAGEIEAQNEIIQNFINDLTQLVVENQRNFESSALLVIAMSRLICMSISVAPSLEAVKELVLESLEVGILLNKKTNPNMESNQIQLKIG